jgi:hypothetical protein
LEIARSGLFLRLSSSVITKGFAGKYSVENEGQPADEILMKVILKR